MQLHFTGQNVDVTPALKDFTTEKFKVLEKHYSKITNVYIVFHIENVTHIAEATVHLTGAEIHASAQDKDMYNAIGMLVDKLVHQIIKHKEKESDYR